jgi:CspA family cold shock protein
MKTSACAVGIGVSLAFFAPAFGIENPAWTNSVSEATPKHFLLAQAVNQTGTVKWFNERQGFGIITPDDNSPDVFFHFSAIQFSTIQGGGVRGLTPGQKVMYDVTPGEKRPHAANVRAI